jgi:uncharacterized membrane protein YeaQ/YmgE (transglycosylase-associated protein family)
MQELVPVVIGIVIGIVAGPSPTRRRAIGAAVTSVALGVAVAAVAGELAQSVGYAVFDAGVIACTAALVVTAQRLARRTGRTQHDTQQEAGHG